MDKVLQLKLTFILQFMHTGNILRLPEDWFVVTEAGANDATGKKTYKLVDLFRKYHTDIMQELQKNHITVDLRGHEFIFRMC